MKLQKLAACTGLPLTEEEPEKSANLCFHCNHFLRLTQHIAVPVPCAEKNLQEFALPLPLDLDAPSASAELLQKLRPP